MKRNRRKRAALLILGLPAVVLCLLAWLMWREVRQSRLNHALILALHNHERVHVVALLHQGADPNARDVGERPLTWRDLLDRWLHRPSATGLADTALMIAARAGRRDEVDLLLQSGANPNLSNAHQDTPISIALNADALSTDLIRDLLLHGVDPNTRVADVQWSKRTTILIRIFDIPYPSMSALARRQLVKLLLDRGADVRATDEVGQSSLMAACTLPNRDAEIARWLMERGADINHADRKGQTPLRIAIDCTPIRTELLRRGVDITPAHNRGWNLLIWAAEEDNLPALQTALERGIPADCRDKMQRTPLMFAAALGSRRSIPLLLAHGATVDAQDKNGWTALMFAAQHGDTAVIQALLQHGANPRLRDSERGWTAAQHAASVGQEQTARWLQMGNPPQTVPPANPERPWLVPDDRGEPDPIRLRVDSRRRIKFIRPGSHGNYDALVVDNRGHHGKAYEYYWEFPGVWGFTDTNGRHYAWFIPRYHPRFPQLLMEVRGLDLVKRGERNGTYGAGNYCQQLPNGGALLVIFRYDHDESQDLTNVPAGHQDDTIAQVTRFRDGKLTDLGWLFMPERQQ